MAKYLMHRIESRGGGFNFFAPKAEAEARLLPYGIYLCHDGAMVLYDRWYRPILKRSPDGVVSADDPIRFVENIKKQCWFYHDGTSPRINKRTKAKCKEILARWQVAVGSILDDTAWDESETQDSEKWYAPR